MSKARKQATDTKTRRRPSQGKAGKRQQTYCWQELIQGIRRFLPRKGLPLQVAGKRVRWTPRLLVICVLLMVWSQSQALADRFADARLATIKIHKSRRRPGKTYEGFMASLCGMSKELLDRVCNTLRASVQEIAGSHWTVEGWILFGADGTKVECPMTRANEKAFGCAGKRNSTPQQFLTMVLHLGTGLPWAWIRGHGRSSERRHLRRMVKLLPENSMLVADAGFTGYELLSSILDSGRQFIVRVGSNVRLLKKLGYAFKEREGTVYLWPEDKRKKCPPLVLRLVTLHDGRKPMYLLTSVLAPAKLSDAAVGRIYRLRWGIEVHYRSLKQTMGKRKMHSDCPRHARVELDWTVVGHWIMQLMAVSELIAAGKDPRSCSVAESLRVLRKMMKEPDQRCGRGALGRRLRAAVKDTYVRTSSKKARHWPRKKTEKPPGRPKMRMATKTEIREAQVFKIEQAPLRFAA